jgi:hypothetical protein
VGLQQLRAGVGQAISLHKLVRSSAPAQFAPMVALIVQLDSMARDGVEFGRIIHAFVITLDVRKRIFPLTFATSSPILQLSTGQPAPQTENENGKD